MAAAHGVDALVTGAGGMVGASLVPRLLADGLSVAALGREPGVPARLAGLADRLHVVGCDLRDAARVAAVMGDLRPRVVFHLAATALHPPPSAADHVDLNVRGTAHVMIAAAQAGVKRVVHTGTAAQYGAGAALRETDPDRPDSPLGIAKCCAAQVLHGFGRLHGVETVELRLFTPYGPWERPTRLVAQTILCALAGRDVPVGQPDVVRDWVFVADVVDALVRAADADLPAGAVLNVASGTGVRVIDMVRAILAEMDTRSVARIDPAARRAHDIPALSGDPGAADRALGWRATTPLPEGIRRTVAWFRDNRVLAETLR